MINGVQFLAGATDFSLLRSIQTGSGEHPTSYPMGTRGLFLKLKVAGM
jgi:hypothetical protein